MIKDIDADDQPDKEIHKVRSQQVPSIGFSGRIEFHFPRT